MTVSQMMTTEQFARVASTCNNWSRRSLGVVRAILVDGISLNVAAATYEMSKQQANVVRSRFLAKAEKLRVDSFMAREKPKLATTALESFSADMRLLRDKGYTIKQIVTFLRENGVETSVTTVRTFLRSNEA